MANPGGVKEVESKEAESQRQGAVQVQEEGLRQTPVPRGGNKGRDAERSAG
jgi:hypothetical protein